MIELSNVNLHYPVPGHFSHSLQTTISSKIGGVLGSSSAKDKEMKYVHALRDINLKLEDSSRLGIIGHNGAGKTTLLRLLSQVYPPTSGKVTIEGKISALTDFTLGMDPNATGLKNIEFRLVFMGCTFKEAQQAVEEIVAFQNSANLSIYQSRTYSHRYVLTFGFCNFYTFHSGYIDFR